MGFHGLSIDIILYTCLYIFFAQTVHPGPSISLTKAWHQAAATAALKPSQAEAANVRSSKHVEVKCQSDIFNFGNICCRIVAQTMLLGNVKGPLEAPTS